MFNLEANGTTVRTELIAGLTTYLTMVYIAFVNPTILAAAGMDKGAVFVATCLAAAFGSALMGLWANYPVALAPGMGINAYFAYSVVKGLACRWQIALGAVFLSGVLFFLVSVTPVRAWVINSISKSMKLAISVGHRFLPPRSSGCRAAGIVAADPDDLGELGDLKTPAVALAVAAFLLMAALEALKVRGAILIGILAAVHREPRARAHTLCRGRIAAAVDRARAPADGHTRRARPRPGGDRVHVLLHRRLR